MSEWWAYSLSDLLMFSPRVYYRLLEHYNGALWPAQILTIVSGLLIIYLLLRPAGWSNRLIAGILGVLWLWIGWAFLWERFSTINWPIAYIVPLFVLQGVLLIWIGAVRGRLIFGAEQAVTQFALLAIFAATLLFYPLIAPLMNRSLLSAEVLGLAPDPTSIATLALLALAQGPARWPLMIVPMLWCVISSVTLSAMEIGDFFLPLAGGLTAIVVAIAGSVRRQVRQHK